jgi:hypothetical protein
LHARIAARLFFAAPEGARFAALAAGTGENAALRKRGVNLDMHRRKAWIVPAI